MTRSTKTRLLLRDKCKVVHSDRLYRPDVIIQILPSISMCLDTHIGLIRSHFFNILCYFHVICSV